MFTDLFSLPIKVSICPLHVTCTLCMYMYMYNVHVHICGVLLNKETEIVQIKLW